MYKNSFRNYAWLLLASGTAGLIAAFALTVEKVRLLSEPGTAAACDINPLVQCGANLSSWQGELFGFPNPLVGLVGWPIVLTVAVLIASGVRIPAWFSRIFTIGMSAAFAFIVWLMYVSFFQLGTLCPWCMVTWLSTIPAFVATVANSFRAKVWTGSASEKRLGETLWFWSPTIILVIVGTAAAVAQIQLNWIVNAF